MSCSCLDADPWDVYHREERTARKTHRCCECRRDRIRPGDRYVEHRGLLDGEWTTYRVCARCERVGDAMLAEAAASRKADREQFPNEPWRWDWDLCWLFGDMREVLSTRTRSRREARAKEADRG